MFKRGLVDANRLSVAGMTSLFLRKHFLATSYASYDVVIFVLASFHGAIRTLRRRYSPLPRFSQRHSLPATSLFYSRLFFTTSFTRYDVAIPSLSAFRDSIHSLRRRYSVPPCFSQRHSLPATSLFHPRLFFTTLFSSYDASISFPPLFYDVIQGSGKSLGGLRMMENMKAKSSSIR